MLRDPGLLLEDDPRERIAAECQSVAEPLTPEETTLVEMFETGCFEELDFDEASIDGYFRLLSPAEMVGDVAITDLASILARVAPDFGLRFGSSYLEHRLDRFAKKSKDMKLETKPFMAATSLLVPLNGSGHWVLGSVDIESKTCRLLDPIKPPIAAAEFQERLQRVAELYTKLVFQTTDEQHVWTMMKSKEKLPTQLGDKECGVFVMAWTHCRAFGFPLDCFDGSNIAHVRRKLLAFLLTHRKKKSVSS